jgi:hypothetical protein
MELHWFILVAGVLHFGILCASALVPKVLDWKASLQKLDALSRQLVWVHGVFIVLVIIGFGLLSILFARELSARTPLARGVCFFIGFFWAARLAVQFFVFDAKPYLSTPFLKMGYCGLTAVFAYQTVVYFLAAFLPAHVLLSTH